MKKGIVNKKKRKAVAARAAKRSARTKKVAAEKHLRREQFEKDQALQKHKEDKPFKELMKARGLQ